MITRRVLCLLTLALIIGCAGAGPQTATQKDPGALRIIANVPFYPQGEDQCGPASLAAVVNFWGIRATPEDVAKEVFSKSARGTLGIDMLLYARSKRLDASWYSGGPEDLRQNMDEGRPVIVLVDEGFSVFQVNHFMVVIGYNEDGFIVNSGREERKFVPLRSFMNMWEKTKFRTLVIKK